MMITFKFINFPPHLADHILSPSFEFTIEEYNGDRQSRIIKNGKSFHSPDDAFKWAVYYLKNLETLPVGHLKICQFPGYGQIGDMSIRCSIPIHLAISPQLLVGLNESCPKITIPTQCRMQRMHQKLWYKPNEAEKLSPTLLKAPYRPHLKYYGETNEYYLTVALSLVEDYTPNAWNCDPGFWWYGHVLKVDWSSGELWTEKMLASYKCYPNYSYCMMDSIRVFRKERLVVEHAEDFVLCIVIMEQNDRLSEPDLAEKIVSSEAVYRADLKIENSCIITDCQAREWFWRRNCGICSYFVGNVNDIKVDYGHTYEDVFDV